jgi:hypothetical protein
MTTRNDMARLNRLPQRFGATLRRNASPQPMAAQHHDQ